MTVVTRLTAALAALAIPTAASAQTCLGLPPFSAGPVQVSVSGGLDSDSQALGLGLAFGQAEGAFLGLSASRISYDDIDGNTTAVGGSIGWQVPLGPAGRVQLCPGVGGALGFGPDNVAGSGADLSTGSAFFGLQVGGSARTDWGFRIVPTAGLALTISRTELGGSEESNTFGVITLGVGFPFTPQLSILPAVYLPVGLEDADPSFGVVVAINFGS